MSKCVRDADRLDALKPHYTVNDVSTDIEIKKDGVNLSCTRFKTRIRQSGSQVRLTLHTHIRVAFDRRLWSGLTGTPFAITAYPVRDRPRPNQGTRETGSRQGRQSRSESSIHRENQIGRHGWQGGTHGCRSHPRRSYPGRVQGFGFPPLQPLRTEGFLSKLPPPYVEVARVAHHSTEDQLHLPRAEQIAAEGCGEVFKQQRGGSACCDRRKLHLLVFFPSLTVGIRGPQGPARPL